MGSRPFMTYDSVAAAEIAIYSIFLIGGIILCRRHGFTKSSGWRFLIILSLARIVGSGLLLATLNDPTNIGLYVGWVICESLGLGPLVLMILGLLSRAFESMSRAGHDVVKPKWKRGIELLMVVGLILIIVGGTQADYQATESLSFKVSYPAISKAGSAIMIVVVALVGLTILAAARNQRYVSQGERRIIVVAAICFPFIVVRTAYSAIKVLGEVQGTVWLQLGMSTIMEMIVTLLCEVLGFTLDVVPAAPTDTEKYESGRSHRRRHHHRSKRQHRDDRY
ncbi:hypothetical protein VHEMI08801 [[Torrubiella] hemipterigena]|uniref:DUF7702 domain-containing protein n=1 Tax=[Torrubiella] hemipterigena TaxID=1531966 RepID=A0A0A1TQE9_9HYPO|nr:hypothetical protein VHEMI08801 [[Torrubiella] hemipterigena]